MCVYSVSTVDIPWGLKPVEGKAMVHRGECSVIYVALVCCPY